MIWEVYKVVDKYGPLERLKSLGNVRAAHQPAAVQRAVARWPREVDWSKAQAGFHVKMKRRVRK